MSPTILNLRHYNTPVVEGIVQSSSDTGCQVDRLPNHKYYHRDRHGERHNPEPSPGHRGRFDHNRRGHVRRAEGLDPAMSGTVGQSRGSGGNTLGASFPIWGTI